MSRFSNYRIRAIMWFARRLGVPVQVHQAFFAKSTNL